MADGLAVWLDGVRVPEIAFSHILKPEIATLPDTVENEAFCMRLAKHLGIPTRRCRFGNI